MHDAMARIEITKKRQAPKSHGERRAKIPMTTPLAKKDRAIKPSLPAPVNCKVGRELARFAWPQPGNRPGFNWRPHARLEYSIAALEGRALAANVCEKRVFHHAAFKHFR